MKRSWTRKLWKLDKRCADLGQESAEIPVLDAHVEGTTNVMRKKQVALMAFVPRCFLRSVVKKQDGGENFVRSGRK